MYRIALKMLVEDKAKFIGMVLSLMFTAIILIQQSSIFLGVMLRTYSTITDTPRADIWVMDPNVKYIDDITPLRDTDLYYIRNVEGVAWAVPFFKGSIRARLLNGQFQTCILMGVDDGTLIGAPHTMLEGKLEYLRHSDAIIVNKIGAETKLAQNQVQGVPPIPLQVGQQLELNDQRANVVGICDVTRTFQSQPIIYTTYTRALSFSPAERKRMSFVLVKADNTITPQDLCIRIMQRTPFSAYTRDEFANKTIMYYMKNTGIPINFGLAVLLALLIGGAIAGQIFYNFTTDNLKYLALFAVMGASRGLLARMSLLQALWVAFLGWGLGSGWVGLIGLLSNKTELAFRLSWPIFLGAGIIIFVICIIASLISISKIFKIELWTMFK